MNFGTLIGTYGKGVAGSATVNFTTSGGRHCDDSCPLKGNECYAIITEKIVFGSKREMEQHRLDRPVAATVTPTKNKDSAMAYIARATGPRHVNFCIVSG